MATESGVRDKRPTLVKALKAVASDADTGESPVRSVTIQLLPSGEVPYRVEFADERDSEGGVITV